MVDNRPQIQIDLEEAFVEATLKIILFSLIIIPPAILLRSSIDYLFEKDSKDDCLGKGGDLFQDE